MRCVVSSPGNDLGVWRSECHRCWSCISIHFHHSELTTGALNVLIYNLLSGCHHVNGAS